MRGQAGLTWPRVTDSTTINALDESSIRQFQSSLSLVVWPMANKQRTDDLLSPILETALVPRLFSYTWPLNRGRLLFFLAQYLAKYPAVNQSIGRCLGKTHSMFVEEYRSLITRLLAGEP